MEARDLDGNTWDARLLTDEEFEKMKLRNGNEVHRNGTRFMVLLDEGKSGIAFQRGREREFMYYGGLEYAKGVDEISIDGTRYMAFIFDKLEEAYEEWRMEREGRFSAWSLEDTNVWSSYLVFFHDSNWNDDGTWIENPWVD